LADIDRYNFEKDSLDWKSKDGIGLFTTNFGIFQELIGEKTSVLAHIDLLESNHFTPSIPIIRGKE